MTNTPNPIPPDSGWDAIFQRGYKFGEASRAAQQRIALYWRQCGKTDTQTQMMRENMNTAKELPVPWYKRLNCLLGIHSWNEPRPETRFRYRHRTCQYCHTQVWKAQGQEPYLMDGSVCRGDKVPWYRRLAGRAPWRAYSTLGPDNPYLTRYKVLETFLGNIYIHNFGRSDAAGALHDHPWYFFHVIVEGGYMEGVWEDEQLVLYPRCTGYWAFHKATFQHRVELGYANGKPVTNIWTLVITGPKIRTWGFVDLVTRKWSTWTQHQEARANTDENKDISST